MTRKHLSGAICLLFLLTFLGTFLPLYGQSISINTGIERSFKWKYDGETYSMDLNFTRADYDHYRRIRRHQRYAEYTEEHPSHEILGPIVKEITTFCKGENLTDWQTAEFVIAFVQSLEYQREISTPEYPKFPIETLIDEGGDCEDTAILLAALLREMGFSTILLSPPRHMATGIAVEGLNGSHFSWDGKKYFYIETTAENWEIGSIPDSYDGTMEVYEVPGTEGTTALAYNNSTPDYYEPEDLQLAFFMSQDGEWGYYDNQKAYTYKVQLQGPRATLEQISYVGYQRMHGTFTEYKEGTFFTAPPGFASEWIGYGYVPIKVKVVFKDGTVRTFEHREAPVAMR